MNDIEFTVVGNVVNDVELRFTKSGDPVASFRVAQSTRRFDRANDRWIDSDVHYFTVSCWRALAHNVVQSVTKGMPIVVHGKLRSRELEKPCGDHTHLVRYLDIEAQAVGPDLSRGTAVYTRIKRQSVVESEERNLADVMAEAGLIEDERGRLIDASTGELVAESSEAATAVVVEEAAA